MDQRQQGGMQQQQKENSQAQIQSQQPAAQERIEAQNPDNLEEGLQMQAEQVEMQQQKINEQGNNQNISPQNQAEDRENNQQASEQESIEVQENQRENASNHELRENQPNPQEEPEEDVVDEQVEEDKQQVEQPQVNQQQILAPEQKQDEIKEVQIPQQPSIRQKQQLQIIKQKEQSNSKIILQLKQAQQLEQKHLQEITHANESVLQKQKKVEESQAYINRLEKLIENLRGQLGKSRSEQSTLRLSNKGLSTEISNSKQVILELRKRKMELQMSERRLNKEVQKLKKQNGEFKQKLSQIQKIGNILVLQSSIQELKLLTSSQHAQIQQLKIGSQQQTHNYYQQQFNQLQAYQAEINAAKEHIASLDQQLLQLKNQIQLLQENKLNVESKNYTLQQSLIVCQQEKQKLKDQIMAWEKKWQSVEQERAQYKKSKQLDQKVSQYESQRFLGQDNEVQIISNLTDKQQKNLLLKEYLKLETLYEQSKIKQQQAQINLKRALRDTKIKQANVIRKKDYQDLLAKYKKAKICLQGAFTKITNLENRQSSQAGIRQEVNQLLQGNQSRLCQQVIKKTNEQLKNITQKSNQMQLNEQILQLKKENYQLRQNQSRLQKQLKNNEKILHLINDDVQVKKRVIKEKCKIIEQYIDNGYHHKSQHFRERISQLQKQVNILNTNQSIYQVKNLLLIKQNQSYLHQMNHWKSLYHTIKQKLSERIDTSLMESERPIIQNRMEVQSYYCKQCQKRSLAFTQNKQYSQSEVQTQNLYDFHYKEIKQTLLCLKNTISKEIIQNIPESHKKTVKIITQFKEKYEKYIQKYNGKLLELKKEKSQNEAWRTKTRQQIRDQFQQIRDLIGNSRLATALRQAKSLIDYLQNQQQQKGQQEQKSQNPREQGEEQHLQGEQK